MIQLHRYDIGNTLEVLLKIHVVGAEYKSVKIS